MKKIQMDDEKATVILLVTLILALACVYVYVEFLYKPNHTQIVENNPNDIENGQENNNNEEEVSDITKVLVEKESLTFENSVTKLVTKVINDSGDFENLNYTVKLIAQDDTVLKELNLFVGDLYKYQIKYVDSYIEGDYTNIKEVSYEQVK